MDEEGEPPEFQTSRWTLSVQGFIQWQGERQAHHGRGHQEIWENPPDNQTHWSYSEDLQAWSWCHHRCGGWGEMGPKDQSRLRSKQMMSPWTLKWLHRWSANQSERLPSDESDPEISRLPKNVTPSQSRYSSQESLTKSFKTGKLRSEITKLTRPDTPTGISEARESVEADLNSIEEQSDQMLNACFRELLQTDDQQTRLRTILSLFEEHHRESLNRIASSVKELMTKFYKTLQPMPQGGRI